MPAPTPDAGIAALAAERPCTTRRWALKQDITIAGSQNWFPWNGQKIDTPPRVAVTWTSDDDVHSPT